MNYTLTNPTNSASALQLSGSVGVSASGMGIQWDSVPGVDYEVYAKDDLESVVDWTLLDTVSAAAGTNVTQYLDTSTTNIAVRTYRIVVTTP